MTLSKLDKQTLAEGLKLRDLLGGHHFMQYEVGGGGAITEAENKAKAGRARGMWKCRDCDLEALCDPQVWQQWFRLWIAVSDEVREILGRSACGNVLPQGERVRAAERAALAPVGRVLSPEELALTTQVNL